MRTWFSQSLVGGVCCVCLCGDGQTERLVHDPLPAATLSDEVREIIRPDCGSCHTSILPTAKPGAVRVFDLVKSDWQEGMTFEQLEKFKGRLARLGESERQKVEELVTIEQRRRSSTLVE